MQYIKSFPLFEGNMEDAKYAESIYLNSVEGRDLAAVNRWGYRLPRTGTFYIQERYSEYKIEKNPAGKWTVTTTTKAKIDMGEFNTPEECFRRIWAWLITKSGIPSGARIKEYTNWLMNPSCPAWGKALGIQAIEDEYIKVIKGQNLGMVDDLSDIFTSPIWKARFKLIGFDLSERQKEYCRFYIDRNRILGDGDSNSPFMLLWRALDPDIIDFNKKYGKPKVNIPWFSVKLSLTKEFKTKKSNWGNGIEIKIGDASIEIIEDKIIKRYLKELNNSEQEGFGPGEHPLIKFLISVLTDNISNDMFLEICGLLAKMVEQDPKKIKDIPEPYLKEVSKMTGFSDDEIDTIRMTSEFGLI